LLQAAVVVEQEAAHTLLFGVAAAEEQVVA
jgi:hypothetical protein